MQLLRLSLGALGPFSGEHTIDLAELGSSGLFLLEGPTGSGKSTLIDAIVFALYGKVASAGASEDRLRSDHAAPDAETYVELVFATGAGLFRVRRTPAYRRPKQRGAGTTVQQSTVKLWRLSSPDAPGELVSARLDEAGAELTRVVGLDRTQFVQTVVLPQGEFASFLRAEPEQRRGLLQRVFGTEVYDRVQQRLERMRADAAREVAEAGQEVERELARFRGAAGVAAKDGPTDVAGHEGAAGTEADEPTPEQIGAALAEEAEASRRAATDAVVRAGAVREQRDQRRAALALAERRDRLAGALLALEAAAPEHEAARGRLLLADAAEQVWAWVDAAQRAGAVAAQAGPVLAAARDAADPDLREVVGAGDAEVQLKALAAELERCAAARGALVRALEIEPGIALRREDLAARRGALVAARSALVQRSAAVDAFPARRLALAAEQAAAAQVARGLASARLLLADVEQRVRAADEAQQLTVQLAAARAELARLTDAALVAARQLAAAHEARIAGIAGELAADLVPGAPCPVCGGTEHPAPAPAAPPAAATDELEQSRLAAERALQAQAGMVEALRERLAARTQLAGEDPARDLAAAHETVATCQEAADLESRLAAELTALDAEHDAARAELTAASDDLAAELARTDEVAAALDRDEAEVLVAADGAASVRAKDDELRRRAAHARDWSAALSTFAEASAAQDRAERDRDAALERAGLDLDEVLRTRLPRAEAATLRAAVEARTAELDRVTSALAELPPVPATDLARADLDEAEASLGAAEAEARTTTERAAVLAGRASAAAAALIGLRDALAALDAVRAQAAPVTRMANVAAASGGEGALTLATYVLGQRFEDLVAAANARLGQMSDGRYELLRSTEKEDVRSRRIGLALKVVDHRTGVARDPRTLSGGETFYVSLCLALGLADVVTAEAGGTELGTLLVDEGFGSLDGETLEVVLGELSRLRDGGRVVGVVSHVETLKQAIAERVEVRRRPDGSSTLTVRA